MLQALRSRTAVLQIWTKLVLGVQMPDKRHVSVRRSSIAGKMGGKLLMCCCHRIFVTAPCQQANNKGQQQHASLCSLWTHSSCRNSKMGNCCTCDIEGRKCR